MEKISKNVIDIIPIRYEVGQVFYYEVNVSIKGTNVRINNTN